MESDWIVLQRILFDYRSIVSCFCNSQSSGWVVTDHHWNERECCLDTSILYQIRENVLVVPEPHIWLHVDKSTLKIFHDNGSIVCVSLLGSRIGIIEIFISSTNVLTIPFSTVLWGYLGDIAGWTGYLFDVINGWRLWSIFLSQQM